MRRLSFTPQRGGWLDRIRHRATDIASAMFLAAVVLVPPLLFIWLVFSTDNFQVKAITIVDARPHTEEAVRRLAQETMNKNIFFVATDVTEQEIAGTIPQIRNVHIVRKLPATLKITVQEKTPQLLLLSRGDYFFIDHDGIAYEEARLETLPGLVLPLVKNDDTQADLTLGTSVIAPEFVTFVQTIQADLPGVVDAQVAEIRIPSLAAREVHFHLDNNWQLRLDSTRPAAAQLAILDRLLFGTISEEERAGLQYVDLRIPNRIYYRTSAP